MRGTAIGFALAILMSALMTAAHADEKRLALVLSNEDYPTAIGRLTQTHADGDKVEAALEDVHFKVTRRRDLDSDEMDQVLAAFEKDINAEAADGDEVTVFFYASMHGAAAEVDGRSRNFLLPAREDLSTTGQVIRKGFRLDEIVSGFKNTKAHAILIVSDACRNNIGVSYAKGGDKGFVSERTGGRVLIAYATEEGATTVVSDLR